MPDGFDIPLPFLNQPFHIYFYGIIIMLGVIAAALMARLEAKRRGLDPELVWDMLFWLVLAGIVGARIWHILTPPPSMVEQGITTMYYLTHPLDMLNIRAGGLGIPGAVIGGALAMWFYLRKKKMSFAIWVDVAAPGLALAQAIGRWGNYFNQELYGAPTNLPWKIYIDPLHRLPGFENYSYYHPLFLYESLWNLASMFFLLWLGRRFTERLKAGDIFLTYLIAYPIGRFCLDFLRLDASQLGGINANQTFVAIVAVVTVGLLIWRHRFAKVAVPSVPLVEEAVSPLADFSTSKEDKMAFLRRLIGEKKQQLPPMLKEQSYRIYFDFIRKKMDKATNDAVREDIVGKAMAGARDPFAIASAIANATVSAKTSGAWEKALFDRALQWVVTRYHLSKNVAVRIIEQCNTEYMHAQRMAMSGSDDAIRYFTEILEIDPEFDNAWLDKGNTLYLLKKYDDAMECYNMALKVNPDNKGAQEGKEKALRSHSAG